MLVKFSQIQKAQPPWIKEGCESRWLTNESYVQERHSFACLSNRHFPRRKNKNKTDVALTQLAWNWMTTCQRVRNDKSYDQRGLSFAHSQDVTSQKLLHNKSWMFCIAGERMVASIATMSVECYDVLTRSSHCPSFVCFWRCEGPMPKHHMGWSRRYFTLIWDWSPVIT